MLLVAALLMPACSKQAHDNVPLEAREPGFAAQAEAVRAGKSDQIRLDRALVEDEHLDALDGLEDKLRRINLSRTHVTDAGLGRIATMKQLEQLRLASDRITDAGLACLVNLKELRHLHLIGIPLTDVGLAQLEPLKGLRSLYLDGTKATDAGIEELIKALPEVHVHFDGGHHVVDPHAADHDHPAQPDRRVP